jgi:hypothetical protein
MTSAATRIHVVRAFALELTQNAGAKEKKRMSHAIQARDERASPFLVEASNAGNERNTQIKNPATRNARRYRGEDGRRRCKATDYLWFTPAKNRAKLELVSIENKGSA